MTPGPETLRPASLMPLLAVALLAVAHAQEPAAEDLSLSSFTEELLVSGPTDRTPRFDAHKPGSYQIDKLELIRALGEAHSKHPVLGALAFGPFGPLSTYEVAVYLKEDSGVRINWLRMPHARITAKATGLVSSETYRELAQRLRQSPQLKSGAPSFTAVEGPDAKPAERRYGFLFADWSRGPEELRFCGATPYDGELNDELRKIFQAVDQVLQRVTATYPPRSSEGDT